MKHFFAFLVMMFSMSSQAAWNEVECEGERDGVKLFLEIERPFPNGSHFKRAYLYVTENGAERSIPYSVTTRVDSVMRRVDYSAPGLRLEVNYGPDNRPRWGWTYWGTIQTNAIRNRFIQVNCRFQNAF